MDTIALKNCNLVVSRIGMGGCPAGEFGWGNVDRGEVERAFHDALDHGVNLFDTADTYGLGRSEETLGETLGSRRHEAVIATKFGVRVENGRTGYDNSPSYIHSALEHSLRRLRTDYIDLYQAHYLDGVTPIEDMMETLIDLKKKGKIRAIGVGNLTKPDMEKLLPYKGQISAFQHHYSLAHRTDEALIAKISDELDMNLISWGSLGQGILTGKYDQNVTFDSADRRSRAVYDNFHGEKLAQNLEIVEKMRPIAKAHGVPVCAVALRWILDTFPHGVALTGVKTPKQADENRAALSFTLQKDELVTLDEVSRQSK